MVEEITLNEVLQDIDHRLSLIEKQLSHMNEEQQRNQEALLSPSYSRFKKDLDSGKTIEKLLDENNYPFVFVMRNAARKNDLELVEKMIYSGIDPDEECMESAVKFNNIDMTKLLIKHKCPRYRLRNLTIACELGSLEMLKIFAEDLGEPLHNNLLVPAVISKNFDLVKYLIKKGLTYDENLIELAKKYQLDSIANKLSKVLKARIAELDAIEKE